MGLAFTGHLMSLRQHIYGLQDHLQRAAQNPVTLQMEEIMTQAGQLKADHAYIMLYIWLFGGALFMIGVSFLPRGNIVDMKVG